MQLNDLGKIDDVLNLNSSIEPPDCSSKTEIRRKPVWGKIVIKSDRKSFQNESRSLSLIKSAVIRSKCFIAA